MVAEFNVNIVQALLKLKSSIHFLSISRSIQRLLVYLIKVCLFDILIAFPDLKYSLFIEKH